MWLKYQVSCANLCSACPPDSVMRGGCLSLGALMGSKSGSFYLNSPFKRSSVTAYSSGLNWAGKSVPPTGHLVMSGDIFLVFTTGSGGHSTGGHIQWVGPRDAAKHPTCTR